MLADPLSIPNSLAIAIGSNDAAPTPTVEVQLRTFDAALGRSVRVGNLSTLITGAHKATMTISHSESKENKGILTDRSATRLEVRKSSADSPDVIAQATLTVSTPRSSFTAAEVKSITLALMSFLTIQSDGTDYVFNTEMLDRILAGEP